MRMVFPIPPLLMLLPVWVFHEKLFIITLKIKKTLFSSVI